MATLIFAVVIIAVVAVFSVQNAAPVAVSFLSWHFEASLAVVILLSVLAGVITGMIVLSWIRLRRSARAKRTQEEERTQPQEPGRS